MQIKRCLGRLVVCILLGLVLSVLARSQSITIPESDAQNWNDVFFSIPLAGPVAFVMQGGIRNGRSLTRPVDERIGVGISFRVGKHLTVNPAYLYAATQPFKGRSVFENRLSIVSTIRFPLRHFVLNDRNVFERRLRHPGTESTRYRNRFQVDHPIGPGRLGLSLFVSDEVYYDWSFNAWVRNRASTGVSRAFNKHLTLDLYYLRQNDSHSLPGDLHVIGTAWRFKL